MGTFEIRRPSGESVAVPQGKLRALFCGLALRPGRTASMTEIAEWLWDGAPPPSARTTIRGYVKRLRRLLDVATGESAITSTQHGYRLEISPGDVDVHRFSALVTRAVPLAGSAEEARLLREALALWRGPAFCDVSSDSLHRDIGPALREQYLDAVWRRIEYDLRSGDPANVVAELRHLVKENPIRETFWAQLMRALEGAGRAAEALAAYAECREVLADELGVDPCGQLRELHQRILLGKPAPAPV
ncbi:BTAD domain-containing putative transcriptional regulator [Streptomyces phyllanthi]|uniref:AfsR/SARP family transcriptional regulator n=1 Tax=Streptomyces phyllanthi TaxID=1803180 RepID=UPI0018832013|nr:BTAD domain-containing putative transcriptional regulator [Streptomyces phyllanthi]